MATPNLAITHLGQNQSNPQDPVNNALDGLDRAFNDDFNITITGNYTLGSTNFTSNVAFHLSGTPGAPFTFFIPASKRLFVVQNDTDSAATVVVTGSVGTSVEVGAGDRALIYSEGTNCESVAGGSVSNGLPGYGEPQIETTTSRTFGASDVNKIVRFTNANATTYTIGPDLDFDAVNGSRTVISREGAANLTVAAGAGVTIKALSGTLTISENGIGFLFKTADNTYSLFIGGGGAGGGGGVDIEDDGVSIATASTLNIIGATISAPGGGVVNVDVSSSGGDRAESLITTFDFSVSASNDVSLDLVSTEWDEIFVVGSGLNLVSGEIILMSLSDDGGVSYVPFDRKGHFANTSTDVRSFHIANTVDLAIGQGTGVADSTLNTVIKNAMSATNPTDTRSSFKQSGSAKVQFETGVETGTPVSANRLRIYTSAASNITAGTIKVYGLKYGGVKKPTRETITVSGTSTDWSIPDGAKKVTLVCGAGITFTGDGVVEVQLLNSSTPQNVDRSSVIAFGGDDVLVFNALNIGNAGNLTFLTTEVLGFDMEMISPRDASDKTLFKLFMIGRRTATTNSRRDNYGEQTVAADTNGVRITYTGTSMSGTIYAFIEY